MARKKRFRSENYYLDTTGIMHNRTSLDKILNYSTEEQIIGKDEDGKLIYRKRFQFTTLTNGADNVVGKIADFMELINIKGVIHYGGDYFSLPHSDYRNIEWNVGLQVNGGNVCVKKGGYGTSSGGYVEVEYTKTTD